MLFNRYFADLSHYNGPPSVFNATEYRHYGHPCVGLKAGEGHDLLDPRHEGWAHAAHLEGLAVWHYWLCHPDLYDSPDPEAIRFWEVIGPRYGPRDRAVLDIELSGGVAHDIAYKRRAAVIFQGISKHQLRFYSYEAYIREHSGIVSRGDGWWVAAYGATHTISMSGVNVIATQYTDGHQGASPHSCHGVQGPCDVSYLAFKEYLAMKAGLS
jgi:hypothetical protein